MTRPRQPLSPERTAGTLAALGGLLLLAVLAGLSIGTVVLNPARVLAAAVGAGDLTGAEQTILWQIRLPRVLLGVTVGGGLGIAGAVFQALLRNPLAEPYVLGISSGGTLGAVAVMTLLAGGVLLTPLASFAGAACVMVLVYGLASRRGRLDPYTLLLAGVMVGAFFNALVLLTVALAARDMRYAFLWLMGNLSGAGMDALAVVGPLVLLGAVLLVFQARKLNLIATGEESALQLGVDVPRLKRTGYLLASLLTGLVVSVSGVVGFVGLIIPHTCRLLFGPDHRLLLPASVLTGASFLVLADLLARTLLAPSEIPVGVVTAAVGAPFFLYLLRRS
jgi:iron complex transport system permease protein